MAKLNRFIIDKLQSIDILSIAEDLGIAVKHNKCKCPFHEDKTPSLNIWPSVNGWKCYGCGAKGKNIDLVMKHEGLGFQDACTWIAKRHGISLEYDDKRLSDRQYSGAVTNWVQRKAVKIYPDANKTNNNCQEGSTSSMNPQLSTLTPNLSSQYRGTNNTFCRSIVSTGILTQEQINHAAEVYHLGQTKDDGVIFWQIDEKQQLRDGKIMFYRSDCRRDRDHVPSWVSFRMKKKSKLPNDWKPDYCLFGLHLLGECSETTTANKPTIAIVESEKTAIICSELFAFTPLQEGRDVSCIWLATGGIDALTTESLRPLIGYKVTVFPDTDPHGNSYKKWQAVLSDAQKTLGQTFYLSNLLEKYATEDQKRRKIDIADYLIEGLSQIVH